MLRITQMQHIVEDDYDFNDGMFSGYNERQEAMIKQNGSSKRMLKERIKDTTLEDPKCVFQLMKKH